MEKNVTQTSYTELRQRLKSFLDHLTGNREPIRVVRRNGPNAILMLEDDYNALQETLHLLSTPANVQRLGAAIEQAASADFVDVKL